MTKCQFWIGGVDGSDSQSLSGFIMNKKRSSTDILSYFLSQHSVIEWYSIVNSHIESLDNIFHHISDLLNHFWLAILDNWSSLLVDCLYLGHFTYRILFGEVQTLRLESSEFWMCHYKLLCLNDLLHYARNYISLLSSYRLEVK